MRRGIICIMIVIGLTSLAIAGYTFINSVSDRIIGKVELVEKHYESKDYENAARYAAEAKDNWERFCKNSYLITDKNHATEISTALARIAVLAKGDSDELTAECESALILLKSFKDRQSVTLNNLLVCGKI